MLLSRCGDRSFEPSGRHVVAWRSRRGAAKRRHRPLRKHWRHEQLTLQMALAAALHHSRDVGPVTYNALRSQKTARAEATNNAPQSQRNSVDTEFFSLFEEELSGERSSPLVEVRPQDQVKQNTVEHIIDVPHVQTRDAPVPQILDNVMDTFRLLDRLVAEQVIAVPKISCSSCPSWAVLREPQMVEQLEKVLTILNFLKQKVDIPVPRRGPKVFSQDRVRRLWSRSFTPAGRGEYGGLQGFLPRQGTLKRTVDQIADIPLPRGLGQDFPPGVHFRSSSGSFSGRAESSVFFFSHFSPK